MNNANKPAYPVEYASKRQGGVTSYESAKGLTKRERFAMAAMQGFLSNGQMDTPNHQGAMRYKGLAQESIRYADALLKELEE